jgi:hypothetical protein
MRAWGSRYARVIFERCGKNKRAAARYLDISYHTLEAYLGYGYPPAAGGSRQPGWTRRGRLNRANDATIADATIVKVAPQPATDDDSQRAQAGRAAQSRAGSV